VRVVRSHVSRVRADGILFRAAVAFERALPWLPDLPNPADAANTGRTGLPQG